jgi:hypothetical protein
MATMLRGLSIAFRIRVAIFVALLYTVCAAVGIWLMI